jgi:DNA gyrase subunit A
MTGDRHTGQIIPTSLHAEMQRSYLEYAMSVIVGRALPDARDGLKPVHRRILFAMHELGLLPDRPFRKCARVVGDVLGKYHPHGDQSVYDALVRLVQDFSCRYPLLAGHGNFGSVDDDPPAAMRYTECRLSGIGQSALLEELNRAVVDFTDNFDGSQEEPVVLPARLPVLLLNGAGGIAVGMATNIPPHNLGELVDGAIALVDRPTLSDAELMQFIPAPDFPTGGIIVDDGGISETYTTGRGSLVLRGVAEINTDYRIKGKRSRQAIIVTELPFQVNKANWIEKVAELVEQNKLEDILDVRDESDRTGLRVVIELRKEANAEAILEKLYRLTALQVNFGAILLALKTTNCGSQPKQMSLKELLQEFLDFREETLTRRLQHELGQAQQKLHLVSGFLQAIAHLDQVISLIRNAPDSATAKIALQDTLGVSPAQADAILGLPLRRLTALERRSLHDEQASLSQEIQRLEKLLSDRKELLKVLKKDLRDLKKLYGDPRRTKIVKLADLQQTVSPEIANGHAPTELLVQVSYRGYIRTVDRESKFNKTYQSTDDVLVASFPALSTQQLMIYCASGKAVPVAVSQIPLSKSTKQKGVPLVTLLSDPEDQPISLSPWTEPEENNTQSLVLISSDAKIKRTALKELQHLSSRGLTVIKLKEQEQLFWAQVVDVNHQLAIATDTGRILRMRADEEQIPILSRTAMGNLAMRLGMQENLVGAVSFDLMQFPDTELVLVTEMGFARRIRADGLRLSPRGSIGSQAIKFHSKSDKLKAITVIESPSDLKEPLTLVIQQERNLRTVAIALSDIPAQPHHPQGRYVLAGAQELSAGETVARLISPL